MPYDSHQVYQEARDIIRYSFDLELTPIEAVKLRVYIRDGLHSQSTNLRDRFEPATEAVSRFFSREYGISPHTHMDNMLHWYKDPAFNAYLKRLQERFHFP